MKAGLLRDLCGLLFHPAFLEQEIAERAEAWPGLFWTKFWTKLDGVASGSDHGPP